MKEILNIKQSLGFVDPRFGMKECELCDSGEWRPGVSCEVAPREEAGAGKDPEAEAAVKAITEQIVRRLNA
jgi:L-fuculose-phosphate aldolase